MILESALVIFAAAARIDSIGFTTVGSRRAVRIAVAGQPADIALRREPGTARIVVTDTVLGLRFGGVRRAVWLGNGRAGARWLIGPRVPWLDRIEIDAGADRVSLVLRSSEATTMELRRDAQGLLLVLGFPPGRAPVAKRPGAAAESASLRASPEPPSRPPPEISRESMTGGESPGPIADLYPRLFPAEREEAPMPPSAGQLPEDETTLGPLRLRAALDARYINGDTFLESAQPQRDAYLEIDPRAGLDAPIGAGRLSLDYAPVLRALASYDQVNRNSHVASATAELPLGRRVGLRLRDSFAAGTLDTRLVDPGGEYFFGLGRFRRHNLATTVSIALGGRTSLELAGAFGSLRFQEPARFFEYDSRRVGTGVVFEVTPKLKSSVTYAYDRVPRPRERPEAEVRAHSLDLAFSGDLLPRLSGELALGYRLQNNPQVVVASGRRYSGLTFAGSLTRPLTPESSLSLRLSRSTPLSAYEGNGFYVSTALDAALAVPLRFGVRLSGGLARQWNEYRVPAAASPDPRRDRILSWYLALRRPLRGGLSLGVDYRSERRHSTSDLFRAHSSAFLVQLGWNLIGKGSR